MKTLLATGQVVIQQTANRWGKTGRVSKPWTNSTFTSFFQETDDLGMDPGVVSMYTKSNGHTISYIYGNTFSAGGRATYTYGIQFCIDLAAGINVNTLAPPYRALWGGALFNAYVRNSGVTQYFS